MGYTLYKAVDILFAIIEFAILARVLLSWLPAPKENKIIQFLYMITEPILAPIRRIIERSAFGKNMMFDFSPIVAFLIIGLIRNIVIRMLR